MKGLLIVGHSYSDYQFIEKTLYEQGMNQAKPSRRETLTPMAISQELLQTHDISFNNKTEICQIDSGEIWNGLALDLLLGNKDQLFWGWADPQAILLLDYWRKLGSQLKFLLVYDTPEAICANIFKDKRITQQALKQEVKHWQCFYQELLHFYQRNQQSCLLVHIEQIKENFSEFIHSTSKLVGYNPIDEDTIVSIPSTTNKMEQFLITELLKNFPIIYDSYKELQSVADIPLTNISKETSHLDNAILAWNNKKEISMLQKKKEEQQEKKLAQLQQEKNSSSHQHKNEIRKVKDEAELLLLQLHQVQEELEHYFIKNQETEKKLKISKEKNSTLQQEKNNISNKYNNNIKELKDENELLLLQLHQVQEELEHYFIKNQEAEKNLEIVKEKNISLKNEKNNLTDQYKQSIEKIKEQESKENNLLQYKLHQIHHIQQELENYFINNKNIEKKLAALDQTTVKPKRYYGAAKRAKNHLSYRLGALMIQHSRSVSGWLTMPIALFKESREFRRYLKKMNDKKLPPISQYQDASEAERVRQYFTYKLGYELVVKTKSIADLITLPSRLRKEVVAFEKNKQLHVV